MERLIGGQLYDTVLTQTLPEVLTPALTPPATVAATASWTSPPIPTQAFPHLAVGVLSSQNGLLSVQPCLDVLGLLPTGTVLTAAITANTAAIVDASPTEVFQALSITIGNTGTVAATLSALSCTLQG